MNIFDLNYEFKIIEFNILDNFEIGPLRIDINRFVLNNSTDAVVQCLVRDKEGKFKSILLTEMMAGFGYVNSGEDAIRYTIPQGSVIYFKVIGAAATTGKMYVTLAQ